MNLKFVESFVWVARLKSFRLAAEKTFSTQAAISNRIATLEEELNVKLFNRDSRTITLTAQGQVALEHAERLLELQHSLKSAMSEGAQQTRAFRIGAMDTVVHSWLNLFVSRLMEHHPELEIELTIDTARNLTEHLEKGFLDLVLQTDLIRGENISSRWLAHYNMCWVAACDPSRPSAAWSVDELLQSRIITFSKYSRPHQNLQQLLHEREVTTARISCVNSVSAMLSLVREGFGIGAMPSALVIGPVKQGELVELQVDLPLQPMAVVASWQRGGWLAQNEQAVRYAAQSLGTYAASVGEAHIRQDHS